MTSQLKSETARINGAKSKGPKSPETRAKSAANSLRHGLTAVSTVILDCESPDEFKKLLAEFVAMHEPATPAEHDSVEQMAIARWRVRRACMSETALLDVEMHRCQPEFDKQYAGADPGIHLAVAIKNLADDSRALALLSRYESRLQRTYDRAYHTLRELQAARKAQERKHSDPPAAPQDQPPTHQQRRTPCPTSTCGQNGKTRKEPTAARKLRELRVHIGKFSPRIRRIAARSI